MRANRVITIAAVILFLFMSCLTTETFSEIEINSSAPAASTETAPAASTETAAAVNQSSYIKMDQQRKDELETRARQADDQLKLSPAALSAYLAQPCVNDLEKAWSIFAWISENIAYDTESFFYGINRPQTGDSVIQSGMAVCAGYSDLFKLIGDAMGLNVMTISGHGKGYSYKDGDPVEDNHAWTAVMVDGRWRLIDSTWGAGYVGDDRKYYKKFDEFWFDVDPEAMIFSHLPSDHSKQFTQKTWSTAEYASLPNLKPDTFTGGITPDIVHKLINSGLSRESLNRLKELSSYLEMGFGVEQMLEELISEDFSDFVRFFRAPGERAFTAVELPVGLILEKGKEYTFSYRAEDCVRHAIIYNRDWHFALREGEAPYNLAGEYDGTIDEAGFITFNLKCEKAGRIKITAQPEKGDNYGTFLEWVVK